MSGKALIRTLGAASSLAAAWIALAAPAYGVNTAVDVGNLFKFAPADVTIDQGDTVTWRWVGPDFNHDVNSYPGEAEVYDSHAGINPVVDAPPGGIFAHTFTRVGTFKYFCQNHSTMQGTVTVHEAALPPPGRTRAAPVARPGSHRSSPRAASASATSRSGSANRHGSSLRSATATLNGRPVAVQKKDDRFTAQIDLRGFSTGTYEVRIKARTKGGRTLTGVRRYRTCTPKLTGSALPRL